MKRTDEYVRGQVSILSFVMGWLAMMQRNEDSRDKLPMGAGIPPSYYSAIQEIKALTDAITIHIGPED